MSGSRRCWCGADALGAFNAEYRRCAACDTLVLAGDSPADSGRVDDDQRDFYGRDYWFGHQQEMGLPSIVDRARLDLVDRIPEWVRIVLRHVQPPARSLELGCSHGGFVAALAAAGFDAVGLELSPSVAALAEETFGIRVLRGPLESHALAAGTYDLVAAMDVLEHLPDPLSTMSSAARALADDGALLIQTPCYPEGASFEQLVAAGSPFLEMLLPGEHIYLFSRRSLVLLCERIGLSHVVFEPAVFAQYDMCAVCVRQTRATAADAPLQAPASARLVQGLLDLSAKAADLQTRLAVTIADAAQRLENVEVLDRLVRSLRDESEARNTQIETLTGMLRDVSADSEVRLQNTRRLEELLESTREDSAARLAQVQQLEAWLSEAHADSAARLAQVHQLETWLAEANADRAARLEQMGQLDAWLGEANAARQRDATRADAAEAALAESQALLVQGRQQAAAMLDLLEQSRGVLAETRRQMETGNQDARAVARTPGGLLPRVSRRRVIAIDLTPVLPGSENGGAKGLVLTLLEQLATRRDHDYLLLTSARNHDSFAPFERPGMTRLCLETPGAPAPGLVTRVARRVLRQVRGVTGHGRLRSRGVNLLFCPMTDPVQAEPGIPVVSVLYDLQHLSYPMFFTPQERANRDATYARVRKSTDAVVCISEFTRQDALTHLRLPSDSTHTVPIAVHGRLPVVTPQDVRRVRTTYGLGDAPYLLYPANGWPHKNHHVLLVAFARVLRDRPDASLHLVLTGNLLAIEEDLALAIERMGLSGRVHRVGFVPEADLAALWFDAFALVYPSLFEGFGIPVLEAMRFDVPVVCSDVASLPEVAGDAALLIDPRRPASLVTALERLLDEPLLRPTLIAAGRRRLAEFQQADMAATYVRIFNMVLQAPQDVREPRLGGLYEDRWLAPEATIAIGRGAAGRTLALDVQVPDWHPHAQLSLRADLPGERRRVFKVARGATASLSVPLPAAPVTISVQVSPPFVPEGADSRRLTLLLVRGRIVSATGETLHEF